MKINAAVMASPSDNRGIETSRWRLDVITSLPNYSSSQSRRVLCQTHTLFVEMKRPVSRSVRQFRWGKRAAVLNSWGQRLSAERRSKLSKSVTQQHDLNKRALGFAR